MSPVQIHIGEADSGEAARRCERFLDGRLEVRSAKGIHPPAQLLLQSLDLDIGGRVLVLGSPDGVVAQAVAGLQPRAQVTYWTLDAYELSRAFFSRAYNGLANLRCLLSPDLPDFPANLFAPQTPQKFGLSELEEGGWDWILMPIQRAGEALLTGELIRQAFTALRERGKLLAAVDHGRDHWVRERIAGVFGEVTDHRRTPRGAVYVVRKKPSRRLRPRQFNRRFEACLFGRTLQLETRPGIFSHGKLDEGTLALSEMASLGESDRVVDLGCGGGAIGLAAAGAGARRKILLVDSNIRAVHAARRNLAAMKLANAAVLLGYDLGAVKDATFDKALANPPYFSHYQISTLFAAESKRVLAPGGELYLVTKAPDRHVEILQVLFGNCQVQKRRGYNVLKARK